MNVSSSGQASPQGLPTPLPPDNNTPLVSVIMPVYNAAQTVGDAIRSVLRQTYPHWELLVVVDGSPDNSIDVVKTFQDPRIQIIEQANQGVAVARNNGFAHTKGEYIAYLDSDDIWYPHKLQKELETLHRHKTPVAFTYSWYYAFNNQHHLVNTSPAYTDSGAIFEAVLQKDNLIIPSTAMLHRNIIEDVGGYQPLAHHEDFLFFLQIAKKYPGFPTCERLVLYRQSTGGSARGKLDNLASARKSYINDGPEIRAMFSLQDYEGYMKRQKKTLFYALMMYNHTQSARVVYEELSLQDILGDLKGKLCLVSLVTGVNFLFLCRIIIQCLNRWILGIWWQRKSAWAFSSAC